MECPNSRCGAENADGAKFCKSCGLPLSSEPPSVVPTPETPDKQCPACGRSVPAQARFCGKCGCPIGSETAESPHPPEPFPPLEPTAIPVEATPIVDSDATIIRVPTHRPPPYVGMTDTAYTELPPAPTPRFPDDGPQFPAIAGSAGKPLPFAAVGIVAMLAGAVVAWLLLGQVPSPPTAAPPATASKSSPPSTTAVEPPPSIPAPVVPVPAAVDPVPAAPPVEAPAASPGPASHPFLPLTTPDSEPQPTPALRPDRGEEARAKVERKRKREEARMAHEAAAQQAREAAQRAVETAAAAPVVPRSPEELCADQTGFISRNGCEARVCQSREWMYHPFCVKRREQEEQKRRGHFDN